jgi:deazaflavin-dependent oxidoreductase (nitroreductase family)
MRVQTSSRLDAPGLEKGGFIRLTTRGRKTGLPHTVRLRYVQMGDSIYVLAGSNNSDWVLNALDEHRGTIRAGDTLLDVSAELAGKAELDSVLELFRRKFGSQISDGWYGKSKTCLHLSPIGSPRKRGAPSSELKTKMSLRDWRRTGADYYADVASAFDSASEEYDFTIRNNFINTWIRRRSIEVLSRYIRPDDYLLEIGCGTGAEALEVSKKVQGLVALDVSQGMIDLLSAKVKAKHREGKVIPLKLAASELPRAKEFFGGHKIRVAYSFNGALNCEPRIHRFVSQLSDVLEPRGIFVCSIRNTLCLTEAISHALALQFDRMSPRKHQPVMVSVGGRDIPSAYYPPGTFSDFFKPRFKVKEVIALPGLLPPAYLNDYYLRLRRFTSVLERLDSALSGRFPLSRFGDQTLFVFENSK